MIFKFGSVIGVNLGDFMFQFWPIFGEIFNNSVPIWICSFMVELASILVNLWLNFGQILIDIWLKFELNLNWIDFRKFKFQWIELD